MFIVDNAKEIYEYFKSTILCFIARRTKSEKVLTKLSKCDDCEVKRRVAWNKNASRELLTNLSDDKDEFVRAAVAENPNTEVKVLIKLADDEEWEVRLSVVLNNHLPTKYLAKLAEDENEEIRDRAKVRWRIRNSERRLLYKRDIKSRLNCN